MSLSIISPWIRMFETKILGFLIIWSLANSVVAFIFVVDTCIAIVDSRRTRKEIVKEDCYLLLTMIIEVIQFECIKVMIYGSMSRWAWLMCLGNLLL